MKLLIQAKIVKIPYFNFTEIIQLSSLLLALLTSVFAIKAFIRNRKQELENHLFKIKIEALSNLTYEMDNFFIILNRSIVKLSILEDIRNTEEKKKQLLELSLETDEQLYKCHSMIAKYSVFFSSNSTDELLKFSSNIIGNLETDNSNEKDILEQYYQEQLNLADNASNVLREELKLNKLHKSLHLRYR